MKSLESFMLFSRATGSFKIVLLSWLTWNCNPNFFFIGVQFTNIQNNPQCPSPIHSHPPPSSPSNTPSSFPRVSSLYVLSHICFSFCYRVESGGLSQEPRRAEEKNTFPPLLYLLIFCFKEKESRRNSLAQGMETISQKGLWLVCDPMVHLHQV